MSKPFQRLLLVLFAFVILFLIWLFLDRGNHGPPTISKETTFETDEKFVMENGYVDYYAVYSEYFFNSVDPANNGGIQIVEAIGPKREVDFEFYWKRITKGSREIPEGPFYQPFEKFFTEPEDQPFDQPPVYAGDVFQKLYSQPWTAKAYPEGKDWLDANQRALKLTHQAANAKEFALPFYSTDPQNDTLIAALLTYTREVRTLARFLTAQAMYHLGNGEIEKCQECILSVRKLAIKVAGNGTLVEQLVGVALLSFAHDAESELLNSNKLTMEQADAYQAKILAIGPLPGLKNTINKSERLMGLSAAQTVHSHGSTSGLMEGSSMPIGGFDIDVVLRELNVEYDKLVERLSIEDHVVRGKQMSEWEGELDRMMETEGTVTNWLFSMPTRKGRSRLAARVLIALLMPAIKQVDSAHVRGLVMIKLAPIALELEKRYIAEGKFPDSLDAIANEMSKRDANWNVDPFTGKSFLYKKDETGYRLYSLGANGVDNKGEFTNGINEDDTGIHRRLKSTEPKK